MEDLVFGGGLSIWEEITGGNKKKGLKEIQKALDEEREKVTKLLKHIHFMTDFERKEVAITMDWNGIKDNIFSWNVVWMEVLFNTELGKEFIDRIKIKEVENEM